MMMSSCSSSSSWRCCSSCCCCLLKWCLLWSCVSASILAVPHQTTQQRGSSPVLSCPDDFVLHDYYCYRYFGIELRKPFHHAQKICSRFTSSLVSLHSLKEERFVMTLTTVNQSGVWIGLNDEDGPGNGHMEGLFKWSDGEELSPHHYCRWKLGEPNNKKHLDCVQADQLGWAMAPGGCGSSKLPFICKKKACPVNRYWNGVECGYIT